MKVSENNQSDLLHQLLVEYSKINFSEYANLSHNLTDVANIHISIEYAELYATCLIKKQSEYDKPVIELTFSELLDSPKKHIISSVEVLESRIIIDGDVKEISSHRLSAAHEEKLYKSV